MGHHPATSPRNRPRLGEGADFAVTTGVVCGVPLMAPGMVPPCGVPVGRRGGSSSSLRSSGFWSGSCDEHKWGRLNGWKKYGKHGPIMDKLWKILKKHDETWDFRTRWLLLRGAPSWCLTNITQKHHLAAMDELIVNPQKRCRTFLNYQWSYKDCGRILQVSVYNVV